MLYRRVLVLTVSLILIGCGDDGGGGGGTSDAASSMADARGGGADAIQDAELLLTNFSTAGHHAVTTTTGNFSTGCSLAYTVYTPSANDSAPLVVLGHGFARGQANMANLAEHIASFGMRVVTPNYCGADHAQNGADAAALAASIANGASVAHAGQSAGGLAAVIAASQDSSAVAALGLDLVDSNNLGGTAASSLTIPLLGLVGAPSSCNSSNNGEPLFQSGQRYGVRVVDATHCDFEDPTDGLCTGFCGGETNAIAVVRAVAAGFLAWQLGVNASGQEWAEPGGVEWERLVGEGKLAPL